jgi:hypothetical protein
VQENVGIVLRDQRSLTVALPAPRRVDRVEVTLPGEGQCLRAMKSISTSALRASPVTPTHVRAGKRFSAK